MAASFKLGDRRIWDCDSSLYDSFELMSFKRKLDSALITSKNLSMSRLLDPDLKPKNKGSKIAKSIKRLVRALFRSNTSTTGAKNSKYHQCMDSLSLEHRFDFD